MPFVFAEMVPQAKSLIDPKTSPEEKDKLRADVRYSIETVENVARARAQQEKNAKKHAERDRVMATYIPGKRGEQKRLERLHPDVSARTIKGYMAQLRRATVTAPLVLDNWNAVAEGEQLRQKFKITAKKRKTRK